MWESITFVLLGGSLYALMGAAVGALVGAALGGVLGMLLGVSAARWPASSRALARRGAIIGAVGTLALVPMAQASMAAGWQWATLAYAPVFARASYRLMLDLVKRQETEAMASCSPG